MSANMEAVRANNEIRSRPARIYNALKVLRALPKTKIELKSEGDYYRFSVTNEQAYVPDFEFEWSEHKKHYRVYIHTASPNEEKKRRGYCIATINGPLAATDFIQMYRFLERHRANNRDGASE